MTGTNHRVAIVLFYPDIFYVEEIFCQPGIHLEV